MPELLEIDRATKAFSGLKAVDGVSVSISTGEVVALVGPNGSGKTTLLNLISGASPLTAGAVRFKGSRIDGIGEHRIARAGVARTFQLVRILPGLSALENVAVAAMFGRDNLSVPAARRQAAAVLARIGFTGGMDAAASDLTYIDQKRVELARALAMRPEILLLDEWLARSQSNRIVGTASR